MNPNSLTKRMLVMAFVGLIAQSSLSLAANPAMEEAHYFDPDAYAERNKPSHPISEYRFRLNQTSLREGMPVTSAPLLWRESAQGSDEVMNNLLDVLSRMGIDIKSVKQFDQNKRQLTALGDGWKLKVYGDGSRAAFRNYRYMDEKEYAMAKLPPLKPEQLVEAGSRFITEVLGKHILLTEGEALVPFGVQYQINVQQSADGKQAQEEATVAAAVVFSRIFNDVDILGKGSKIAILYANDGTVFGFDFDWPVLYPAGVDQKVVSLNELKHRAIKVSSLEGHEVNVQLERFECGYYDAGQKKRGEAPMQPACFHFYSAQSKARAEDGESGFLTMAFVDAVPAGSEIIADENWDTALELLYGPEAVPERSRPGDSSVVRKKLGYRILPGKDSNI
ncbi:MAG: hypothetical protein KZQ93_04355 [Candidatus Thiodiazotropha sp. (ex Monitilora ramsayi)]|nr:hypothetical protein [Candidatus Thiodiazotropha sp. (ex Monitilora ramsayi)]